MKRHIPVLMRAKQNLTAIRKWYLSQRQVFGMKGNKIIRSPFFYVGDKYKLMPQLRTRMPCDIDQYIEPFAGGGSSF